jgi:hypothetical protein
MAAQAKLIDISAPGIKISDEEARPLREEVARLLGRNQKGFPGAQPVSFARKHIEELMKEECVPPPLFHPQPGPPGRVSPSAGGCSQFSRSSNSGWIVG